MMELFPRLAERASQQAGTLSGGEQQMVAMARALMGRPRVLCMDEPTMGLSPLFVERILELIQAVNRQGVTVFMVEQNAHLALQIADYGYVLQTGRIVLSGPARDLLHDPQDPRRLSGRRTGELRWINTNHRHQLTPARARSPSWRRGWRATSSSWRSRR